MQNGKHTPAESDEVPLLDLGGFIYSDLDTANHHLYILIKKGLWRYDLISDQWKFLSALKNFDENLAEFEFGLQAETGTLYLWDRGVGRVYTIDTRDYSIERIDQSFNHKNQYGHQPFFREGTVYAYGGYGYWTWKNYITYYNGDLKEWSIQDVNPASVIPEGRIARTGIYDASTDQFFVYGGAHPEKEKRPDDLNTTIIRDTDIWKFSFESNRWTHMGILDRDLNIYYQADTRRFGTVNGVSTSFYSDSSRLWYIPTVPEKQGLKTIYLTPVNLSTGDALPSILLPDKLTNEIIPVNYLFDQANRTVVIIGLQKTSNNVPAPLRVAKIPEDSLLVKLEHRTSAGLSTTYYYLAGALLLGLILILLVRKRSDVTSDRRPSFPLNQGDIQSLDWLSGEEQALLQQMMEAESLMESHQLDEMVWPNIDNYDYRRKLRNETINSINDKFRRQMDIGDEVIRRMKDPNDNRRYLYGLNEELVGIGREEVEPVT
ncbi:MAG: hypothetical protein R3211_02725 [Balneolaceae bacterium]|nr:hypothetical protein [Balneolaceae bacterium]